ncbi:MAG: hypothetical protein ABIJ14_00855 [Nanoarchaeota archaeon]|nr:hypothetical protein [Nanoarchaeota archaeon]
MKKLNLGSGNDIRKGWVNVDLIDIAGADIIHNLDHFPYPFEDSTFNQMIAGDIMEHLHNPNKFIKELWRIGKDGCEIKIITPHFTAGEVSEDLSHKRGFAFRSLQQFDIKRDSYEDRFMNPEGIKFEIDVEITFGRLWTSMGISFLVNKFPLVYENLFAYIFQARKIVYKLKVIKGIYK